MAQTAVGQAGETIAEEIKDALRPLKTGPLSIEVSIKHGEPEPPPALHEQVDMILVEPPCHPWEPLKISAEWREPIYCLLCGQAFRLD